MVYLYKLLSPDTPCWVIRCTRQDKQCQIEISPRWAGWRAAIECMLQRTSMTNWKVCK